MPSGLLRSALSYLNLRRRLSVDSRRCFYARVTSRLSDTEHIMGKYFLAWLLGVPGIVLIIIYLFFN